jgi:C4-dicarboxylate-specific signal transduction histidine kinase
MIGVYRYVTRRKAEDQELDTQREQIARLNRASLLGVLSGALAHDLSQPLTGILSNAEAALATLRQKVPDLQEVDAALVDIVSDNLRIMELIRDIRALFERGEVSGAPMDVNECVRSTLNLERGYIIGHRVTVDTRMGVGLPNVMMNAAQLQQVLINLIVNACEAMEQVPESERRLEVSTSARDQQALEVMIADNGPGMESPDSVFDTFFTTKPHGVGLGLAISRMIVTAHGGKLWATNKPIRGATLHLLLPAATQDAASAASQESGVRA